MGVYTKKANWPVGSIVAVASTQVWSLPTADQVKNGYALCNGNPYSSLPIDTYNPSLTGNRPNLTGDRFLMGSNSIGSTGGADTYTLSFSHLPVITTSSESANHNHGFSGTTGTDSADHTHECRTSGSGYLSAGWGGNHGHTSYATDSTGQAHSHYFSDSAYTAAGDTPEGSGFDTRVGWNQPVERANCNGIRQNHTHWGNTGGPSTGHSHTWWAATSGGVEYDHSHGQPSTTNTGSINAGGDHSHSYTNASQTSVNNKPTNLSVVFLIKVK